MRNLNDISVYVKKFALGGDITELGGKAHRLTELYKAGFNVPEGFVITTRAFDEFLDINHLRNLELPSDRIKLILPAHLICIFHDYYKQTFGTGKVIIRSSATIEDLPETSFAGVYKSVHDITEDLLDEAIIDVYHSVFSAHAIEYIKQNNLLLHVVKMAIIVQRQIAPTFSGVCFTVNPVNGNKEYIVEFVRGRDIAMLSGKVPPERLVFTPNFDLVNTKSVHNEINLDIVKRLVRTCSKIEELFNQPQDIEWAIDINNTIHIFQSRDITTIKRLKPVYKNTLKRETIVKGIGVSSGVATGKSRKLLPDLTEEEAIKIVKPGDIVVTYTLRIDHLKALSQSAGVITAEASLLSHTAIRARELGIPCVGGIPAALSIINENQLITIDGDSGTVYLGKLLKRKEHKEKPRFIYYNPERVKAIKKNKKIILYEKIKDKIVVYIDKIGDEPTRKEAIQTLSSVLQVNPSIIIVDEHGLWETENTPSLVYDQYMTIQGLKKKRTTARLLKEGIEIAEKLDYRLLHKFINKVDTQARDLFLQSIKFWNRYITTGDRRYAEKSAELLDTAKNYQGNLIGVAIIDVYGTYFLEKAITSVDESCSVKEIYITASRMMFKKDDIKKELNDLRKKFSTKQINNRFILRLVRYAICLSEYKNKRLEILTHDGYTALDMIEEFYKYGLSDIVSKHKW